MFIGSCAGCEDRLEAVPYLCGETSILSLKCYSACLNLCLILCVNVAASALMMLLNTSLVQALNPIQKLNVLVWPQVPSMLERSHSVALCSQTVHVTRLRVCTCMDHVLEHFQLCIVLAGSNLVAYHDVDGCGPNGPNYHWDWCGRTDAECANTVRTTECPHGFAYLDSLQHVAFNNYTLITQGRYPKNCSYEYYAEYQCHGVSFSCLGNQV